MREWAKALGCVALAASLSACVPAPEEKATHGADPGGGENKTAEAAGASGIAALTGTWQLVLIDGSEPAVELPSPPTIEFTEDGNVAGSSGVNRYTTQIDIEQLAAGKLSLGEVATTRMAGPPLAMVLEGTFLARLASISTYTIEGNTLRFYAGDDEVLTFTRVPVVDGP
jgi:heat shock protein HslJ